jgi:POT family proton-dependent oligopeptide transporter
MSQPSTTSPAKVADVPEKHPRGLSILFFAELWERFSFYGMRALLSLYLKKALNYSETDAQNVFHAYGALVYAFPVIGGKIADALFGYRLAIIVGGVLMALGHFAMALEHELALYLALGLIAVGNGFFKPNISSLVGKLYAQGDPRRDAGFTIFYMGINIGAGLSPLACGYIGDAFGWHYGFGLAGIGMLVGLGWFILGRYKLEGHGEPPDPERLDRALLLGLKPLHLVLLGTIVAVPLAALGIWKNEYVGYILYTIGTGVLIYLLYLAFSSGRAGGQRLLLIIVLMFFHTTFWAVFEQAGGSFTFLTDKFINRKIFSFELATPQFQFFNAAFIVMLAPVFARMWRKLASWGRNPSIPLKFSWGVIGAALGFFIIVLGGQLRGEDGLIPLIWMVLTYLMHTLGELCLSPVGLSAMTKLAPERAVGTVMGAWFLTFSFGHKLAAVIAHMTAGEQGESLPDLERLARYMETYWQVGLLVLGLGLLLALFSPLLKRLAHGVE